MKRIKKKLQKFGISTSDILIPKKSIDQKKWAVIACDQYSSQKEYWDKIALEIGTAPSTLNLIFPECYLNKENEESKIASINRAMNDYYKNNFFDLQKDCFILVKREFRNKKVRYGLMATLDLDKYDFNKGSKSLIRATEGTIIERIPPRLKIRKDATLELPHILVLVDDKDFPLITPLVNASKKESPLYETELLENSGKITGYKIDSKELLSNFAASLKKAADKKSFKKKYNSRDLLLFAIGDGNHSLATAKSNWEIIKKSLPKGEQKKHPARYALVEINSIYDSGIEFEPIHRVLFDSSGEKFLSDFCEAFNCKVSDFENSNLNELALSTPAAQKFALLFEGKTKLVEIENPTSTLTVATVQHFLDNWLNDKEKIDFIHGIDATLELGNKEGNFGIILPNISKADFFKTVIADGSFPRKTFSMGEAHEKRFYFEARKIDLL